MVRERPADDLAAIGVEYNGQVDEGVSEPDIGDVTRPELVDSGRCHLPGQVRIYRQAVIGVRGCHEALFTQTEQVILPHHPQNAFMIDLEALAPQRRRDPAIAVARVVQTNTLDTITQRHIRLWLWIAAQEAIVARAAYPAELAERADARLAGAAPLLDHGVDHCLRRGR